MDAQLKKGLLEICVLSVIDKNPSYGYKIVSDLAPYVKISESTLYPILRRLEQSGALKTQCEEHNGRLRRYFYVTQIGKNRIKEFIDDINQFEKIKRLILGGKNDL